VLGWQIRTAFDGGCAGAFVYSWTDEWFRGGAEAEDWAFGLTTRDRLPKPALAAVRDAFDDTPFSRNVTWPSISVVVCSRNGARTIRECCEGLGKLDYPDFEVIVVDDGSTDDTADIADEYGFRVIRTPNRGLSSARNTGLEAANGEIVAYTDDDAYPDPHWLSYLAYTFTTTSYAAVGGPNIPPPGDGPMAGCIASAPGGPVHVLLSDREAEHIPGCNMAFRKADLQAVGGFDPQFRVAGDDVDVCWRLTQSGRALGFCPAAMVWHHRRGSARTYWKQQRGYGRAEALLESKWPQKYNAAGHVSWGGRVYGNGHMRWLWARGRIYHGLWGSAPFQSIYQPAPGMLASLPLMPEWYLLIPVLAALSALGALWHPLILGLPLLALAVGIPILQCGLTAARTSFLYAPQSAIGAIGMRSLTALLHLLQPLARLYGRLSCGLAPWRRRGPSIFALPWPRTFAVWCEQWRAPGERLQSIESRLRTDGLCVYRGGDFDRWDLEVRGHMLGSARLRTAVEEHGLGRQLVRFRVWPRPSAGGVVLAAFFAVLALGAALDQAWAGSTILGLMAVVLAENTVEQCASATAALLGSVLVLQGAAARTTSPRITVERRVRRTTAADRKVMATEQAFDRQAG
jgi:glycosyltransferase involved in cell wall biosynthesis